MADSSDDDQLMDGNNDSERNEIQSELSKMTFEELQKLKEKLGSKVYKEAMFGTKKVNELTFKRANKNRPREVSSKVKPNIKPVKKKEIIRDPRFDRLCGEFDEKLFKKDYWFLPEIRQNEKKKLKEQLAEETNPNEIERIKFIIQRMENQEREERRKVNKEAKKEKERQEHIKSLQEGRKPHFRTKYEKKVVNLLDTYSDLKKSGKLKKHIERQRKKLNQKDRKDRMFEKNV